MFRENSENTAFVFNCQMGRGRTTTGMVCAYIFQYIRSLQFGNTSMLGEHEKRRKSRKERYRYSRLSELSLKYLSGNYKYSIFILIFSMVTFSQELFKISSTTIIAMIGKVKEPISRKSLMNPLMLVNICKTFANAFMTVRSRQKDWDQVPRHPVAQQNFGSEKD